MTPKRRIFEMMIHFKVRAERGQAWINNLKTPIIIAAGLKIFGLGLEQSLLLVPVILAVTYIIGDIDLKQGIWLREAEICTRDYNPYFNSLEKKVEGKNGKDS